MFRKLLPDIRRRWAPERPKPSSFFDLLDALWTSHHDPGFPVGAEFPAINLSENDKEIKVKAEIPGMEAKDIDISLWGDHLIIQGEKAFEDEESKDSYHRIERRYGSFSRAVPLPAEVDEAKIKAKYKRGVLEVKLPKTERSKARRIEIES